MKYLWDKFSSVQFSSVAQSGPSLCDPMDCSTPGFPVHHELLEIAQTHGDAIQPSRPLSSLLMNIMTLSFRACGRNWYKAV